LPVMGLNGLVSSQTLTGIVLAFPILGAGIWTGTRFFGRTSQTQFRRMVILLLVTLSAFNIAKVLL